MNLENVSTEELREEIKRREDSLKKRFEKALSVVAEVLNEDNLPEHISESDHYYMFENTMCNFWQIAHNRFNIQAWAQSSLC